MRTTKTLMMKMTMLRKRHSVGEWMFDGKDCETLFWRRTWLLFDVEVISSRNFKLTRPVVRRLRWCVALIILGHTYNAARNTVRKFISCTRMNP